MTEHEIELAKALNYCRKLPGTAMKRFCRQMAEIAEHKPEQEISLRQRHYMELCAWHFRRQLPAHLVPHRKPLDLPAVIKSRSPRSRVPTKAAAEGDTAVNDQIEMDLLPCIPKTT